MSTMKRTRHYAYASLHTFFLIGMVIVSWSCTSATKNSPSESPVIVLDYEQRIKSWDKSLIEDIQIVRLQTGDKLMGDIYKVAMDATQLYVLHGDHLLWVFDHKGLFIDQIGSKGKGPEEYIDLNDFVVTEDEIILHSSRGKSLLFYNKENLSFQRKLDLLNFPNTFYPTNNGFIFYMNNNPASLTDKIQHNIYWTNNEIKTIVKQFPYVETKYLGVGGLFESDEKDRFLYLGNFSDTLFSIGEKTTYPKYIISLPNSVPLAHRNLDLFYNLPFEQSVDYNMMIPELAETSTHFFSHLKFNRNAAMPALYNKKTGAFYAADELKEIEYLFKGTNSVLGKYKDQIIFNVAPNMVIHRRSDGTSFLAQLQSRRYGALDDLYLNMTIEDDPVILLVRFAT